SAGNASRQARAIRRHQARSWLELVELEIEIRGDVFLFLGEVALAEIYVAALHLRQQLRRRLDAPVGAAVHLVRIAGEALRVAAHAVTVDQELPGFCIAGAKRFRLRLCGRNAGS